MVTRATLAVAAAMLVLVATSPSRADDARKAEAEYRLGYQALSDGDCETALVHYARSLELARRPRTLFNIGVCQETLGHDDDAWVSFHAFLDLAEERDLAIVSKARKRIEALRERLRGTVTTRSDPPGASIHVDDEPEPRATTPATLSLRPGSHVLRFTIDGHVAAEHVVEIHPGRTDVVDVTLHPSQPTIVPEARVALPARASSENDVHASRDEVVALDVTPPPERSTARVAAGWAAAALGTIGIGAGLTVGVFALRDAAVADVDTQARGESRAWLADGLVAVGAVAVVAAWRLLRAVPR